MAQRWNRSTHNNPVFSYCPNFINPVEFQTLNFLIQTPKFRFSHCEPGHRFTAGITDRYTIEVREKDEEWLFSTECKISKNTKISLANNGNYAVAFNTDLCDAIVTKNTLTIIKHINFDSIQSIFHLKLGSPIKFNANFHSGNFTTGCAVSTSKNVGSNAFQFLYESPHFSNSGFIMFNPLSLKNFSVSDTVSLKEGPFKISASVLYSLVDTIYSTGGRFKSGKITTGFQVWTNKKLTNFQGSPHFERTIKISGGIKYKFPKCITKLLFYNEHCGIGGEFRYKNSIIKPLLTMKYNQSEYGFGFEIKSED